MTWPSRDNSTHVVFVKDFRSAHSSRSGSPDSGVTLTFYGPGRGESKTIQAPTNPESDQRWKTEANYIDTCPCAFSTIFLSCLILVTGWSPVLTDRSASPPSRRSTWPRTRSLAQKSVAKGSGREPCLLSTSFTSSTYNIFFSFCAQQEVINKIMQQVVFCSTRFLFAPQGIRGISHSRTST